MSDNGVIELILFILAILLAAQTVRAWFYRKALLHQRKQHELILKIKDGTIRVLTEDVEHLQKQKTGVTPSGRNLGPKAWPEIIESDN